MRLIGKYQSCAVDHINDFIGHSVDLGFDAMRGHGRSVFPNRRMKDPVEFRTPRVATHVDLYIVRLKITCREIQRKHTQEGD